MARSTDDIQADLDALRAAINSGVSDVTYSDGSRTTYRTYADMLSAEARLVAELNAATGTTTKTTRAIRVNSCKGF